jgi:GT2 family glycosyltransferase
MSIERLSIIVVNWKGLRFLGACLGSLMNQTSSAHELILVDNASNDMSITQAEALHLEASIIRNPVNLGYSGAGSIGIAKAKGKFIVIVNPDTVVNPRWLDGLVDAWKAIRTDW